MKIHFTIFLLISAHFSLAQQPKLIIDIPEGQRPWSSLELNNKAENFQFAIVTDRTGGHRQGVFLDGILKLNLLQPEFVMSVGDLIEGYTTDTVKLNTQWKEFNGFIDSLQMPFFYVPGNHDITNSVMEKKWRELYGKTYYHFVYNDILFMCLNSEDTHRGAGNGMIGDEQFNYIKTTLEQNQHVKWTLLFMHQPLWVQNDTKRWTDVEKLLSGRNHNVFAGHYHRYWKTNRNSGKYIALATTGGGSRLRGTAYGEFDHVVWVTMTPKGPILANLLLEGIWDENVVTDDLVDFVRNRPFPVIIEPTFVDKNTFLVEKANIRITNTSDFPMHVGISPTSHKDLLVSKPIISKEINPNSVEIIEVNIENIKSLNIDDLKPIQFNSTATFSITNRPELEISEVVNFVPQHKKYISKVSKKIKFDGMLKEWGELANRITSDKLSNPFSIKNEEDCSFHFSTQYDEENFYVGFQIYDDDIFTDENIRPDRQDAVIISLDARSMDKSAQNTYQGTSEDFIYLLKTLEEGGDPVNADRLPEGVEVKLKKSSDGFTGELVVPLNYLKKSQMGTLKQLRLNIELIDVDKNGKERVGLHWNPLWNTEQNLPGSGTLFFDK